MLSLITKLSKQSPLAVVAFGYLTLVLVLAQYFLTGPYWIPTPVGLLMQVVWLGAAVIGVVLALRNLAHWRNALTSIGAILLALPLLFVWVFPR